jgi:hypothetical protein
MKLRHSRQDASAVAVVLGLIGILSLYILVNLSTLTRLKHDIRQIERRQLQRLQSKAAPIPAPVAVTNATLIVPPPSARR